MEIDSSQLIQIINDHKGIIYKITKVYAVDIEDRKDLEQEIVIQIWKSLSNFKGQSKLSTWIYRVALNVSIAHNRKATRRQTINDPMDQLIIEPRVEQPQKNGRTEKLYQFIEQLDKFNKAIILLYLDSYSYEEISEIIGISKNNVGVKINRIKAKITNQFNSPVKQ